jgi:hypothetical protein
MIGRKQTPRVAASSHFVENQTLQETAPYDSHLLKHVTSDWRKMARIIGAAIMELDGTQRDELRSGLGTPLDLLFAERLKELAKQGWLEYQGDLNSMGFCELRLPRAK